MNSSIAFILLTDMGINVTLCHSISLFLKIQQVKKLYHLHTFMHQLMSQSQVAGFEKQLTYWVDFSIMAQWVFFNLPLQHLIL